MYLCMYDVCVPYVLCVSLTRDTYVCIHTSGHLCMCVYTLGCLCVCVYDTWMNSLALCPFAHICMYVCMYVHASMLFDNVGTFSE